MDKTILIQARKLIGAHLRSIREEKGLSTYAITKSHGMRFEAIEAVEQGSSSYTIDTFLTYISAIDCYFYTANRDGQHLSQDDLLAKAGLKAKE